MPTGYGGAPKTFAVVVAVGVGLHRLHEAVDGFEWALSVCPWCRLRGQA
jgi:hypothetical protein